MSAAPEGNLTSTVKCAICGRENPIGRTFCKYCKQRILAPPPDEFSPKEEPSPSPEVQSLQSSLQAAQSENQNLRQQIESMQQELDKFKAATVKPEHPPGLVAELQNRLKVAEDKVVSLVSQSAGWESKLKSAEEKAAEFEGKLVAKAKEFEEYFKRNPGAKPNPHLKLISGIIAIVGSLGGYGTGRYVQPKDDATGKVNQLVTEAASAQQQIGNLKSLLNSANKKADQIQNESKAKIDSAKRQLDDLTKASTAREEQLQRQLNEAAARQRSTEAQLAQARAPQTSLTEEIARLRAQLAPHGSLIWTGNLTASRTTIEITNGVLKPGTLGHLGGVLLPGRPCRVSTPNSHVKIKTRPSRENHWNELSFEVPGPGPVEVRIDWDAT